jgi:hypothetical protein
VTIKYIKIINEKTFSNIKEFFFDIIDFC